ncbi:hypothetical protein LSH36_431g01010 [Paralvinella palmiformis]|uniref:Cep192-like domain-containing protein n=1 Tax=Paralvinella palmiformis TaxID=53620 RepID=A0AAD9N0N9_9ANNE|nr:hypothetical protein LSH36_431g01010 [Paralvinella palmiformis]
MSAVGLDGSVALPGRTGTGSLSRTRDILIETMQLVEPRKQIPVPNHLLETKIYSKVTKNAIIEAEPSVLHFGGFELGVTQTRVINFINVSAEVQKMHLIPPQTKFFYVKYNKADRLVPGMALECTVEFTPDEWRYYYDCIRIHCKGEENLVIPLHAYPVMNTDDFPKFIKFPPVPVGHSRSRVLPLRCQAPIDFEFQLTYIQPNPAFKVEPMGGIVPANGEVDVVVTFTPSEFSTAVMKIQLIISQFNTKPLICTVSGSSVPGLSKEMTEKSYHQENSDADNMKNITLDPRAISPLDRARSKRRIKQKPSQLSQVKEIERDGVKFPVEIDTPYAVAQVLNQQPGKLRIKDLREVVLSKKGNSGTPTRQMKEAMFEMAVRQNVYEERQNQLRWQVKVGDESISVKARQQVIEAREDAWIQYRRNRGDPVAEEEYSRRITDLSSERTRRECTTLAKEIAQFDLYKNDPWAVRHTALHRFQQAARRMIIRKRADTKLMSLRQMVIDWGEKKFKQSISTEEREKKGLEEDEAAESSAVNIILSADRVTSFNFPTYVAPDVKDDMAVDALGSVPYKPTQVLVNKKVPYHSLKVPQQYQLMGYEPHGVHEASLHYVSPGLARPLRTGAEEEIISLGDVEPGVIAEPDINIEDVESRPHTPTQTEVVPIKPPVALFKPIEYPALHIFNPSPGLQVFQAPLPYAETDSDFHLCPLPRYTSSNMANPHMSTQRQYLDREDTIHGVMIWKKFPSKSLIALSNTPTVSGVWVPRWEDPFGNELLPEDVPELFTGLTEDDEDNIVEDEGMEEPVNLTPEMVMAEFAQIEALPGTASDEKPKKEDKREQELEYFVKNKYNRLGRKIQKRMDQLNSLKTDLKLILK